MITAFVRSPDRTRFSASQATPAKPPLSSSTVPLISIMFISQTINGILLPFVLIIMLKLVNKREIMGEYVNSKRMNIVTWITVAILILLTVMLVVTSFIL